MSTYKQAKLFGDIKIGFDTETVRLDQCTLA